MSARQTPPPSQALHLDDLDQKTVIFKSSYLDEPIGVQIARAAWERIGRPGLIEVSVRPVRESTRQSLTYEQLARVAELYRAAESTGIEAVASAFNLRRETAAEWVEKARQTGHIMSRTGDADGPDLVLEESIHRGVRNATSRADLRERLIERATRRLEP